MDASRSAFYAYKNSPTKFVEKQKTPKKNKSKTNGRDKTPGKANVSDESRSPAKKRRALENVELTNASSSEYIHNETATNGRPSDKSKVNKSITLEYSGDLSVTIIITTLFHLTFFCLEAK